ncbi:amidase domain-containing protein [Clostridium perfringens]
MKRSSSPFDNYSNYLESKIKSRKEFQDKKDQLIAKLKTQKEDESYKNGIMLKSYDGYNASAAVNYAHKYYEDYNPGFVAYSSDCQNFVSQCVYAGGIPMTDYWHHYTSKYYTYDVTPSWRLVPDFYTYIKNNGYTWGNDYYYDWRLGDVVQMYNPSTGIYSHSVILTGRDPVDGIALYTAHTNNRYDFKLTDGLDEGDFDDWRYIKFWH